MAIIFELVVNFGTDEKAVSAAAELVRQAGHVDVRGIPVPFGDPYTTKLTRPPVHVELSVHMRGFGYGGPGLKPGLDPRSLTSDEITRTGRALYELLRSFSGYRAAIVGWNPESLVDVEDLEADWRSGDPPNYNGLVLADDLCDRWQLGLEWSRFEPGYRWLPYSGSKNLWLSRTNSDLRWSLRISCRIKRRDNQAVRHDRRLQAITCQLLLGGGHEVTGQAQPFNVWMGRGMQWAWKGPSASVRACCGSWPTTA